MTRLPNTSINMRKLVTRNLTASSTYTKETFEMELGVIAEDVREDLTANVTWEGDSVCDWFLVKVTDEDGHDITSQLSESTLLKIDSEIRAQAEDVDWRSESEWTFQEGAYQ